MTISGIYKITNIKNNKIYIGSSKNINRRWNEHKRCLKNNDHHSGHLQNAWNKYGEENFKFEILEIVSNEDELKNIEQKWLDETQCYKKEIGYNISKNAKGVNVSSTDISDIIFGWREIFRDILNGECTEIDVTFHISQVGKVLFGDKIHTTISEKQDKFDELILQLCDEYINLFTKIDTLVECISVEPKIYNKYLSISLFEICKINNKEKRLEFLKDNNFELISFYDGRSGYALDVYRDNYSIHKIINENDRIILLLRTDYKDYEYLLYSY